MTEQLREAFRDLADDAGTAAPPEDLWRRGRRARRRRVASTVLVAGVVLGVVGLVLPGLADPGRTADDPMSFADAGLAVPDRLWTPSRFAPTSDGDDPPGPLAVVGGVGADWSDGEEPPRWFGVSAVDQGYRWLDLPGMSGEYPADVALSPDGRRLAYFLAGEPESAVRQSDVVGYAVYDTVTGEVARHRVPTEHGLSTVDRGLVWTADSSTVVVRYGQWARRKGSSAFARVEAWRPGRRPVPLLEPGKALDVSDLGPGPDGTVVGWRGRDLSQLVQISVSTGEVTVKRVDRGAGDGVPGPPAHNPAGDRIAFRDDRAMRGGGWIAALHVAEVAADGTVGPVRELAPAWMPGELLGWTDDRTLLARGTRDTAEHGPVDKIIRYDVAAGTATTGIGLPREDRLGEVRVAADLLLRPLAEGRQPERWWDFWSVRAAGAAVLAGLGGAVLLLRRRQRPSWPRGGGR